MQKKIKIPKLSLNHVEEAGEVTDYGEEDVELRHSKVLKFYLFFFNSYLFFILIIFPDFSLYFFLFSLLFFVFFLSSAWGIYRRHSLKIPGLLLIPLKLCVC